MNAPLVANASTLNQTVPTRTPTPGPVTPPPTSPPTSPPGGPPPQATQTTPANTATPETSPPTPAGGFLPTAVPCSHQPTILAVNYVSLTNVRLGPGTDYETIGQLVFNEVRPIIGRATNAPWWRIQLRDGQAGWVADEVVEVQGNTANVPMAPAPLRNGVTVTPGAPWQPTPPPSCPTALPPSPTPMPTQTDTPSGETIVALPLTNENETSPYPASATEEGIQTNVKDISAVTPTHTATPITLPTSVAALPLPATTVTAVAPGNEAPAANSPDFSTLLLAGAGLLLAAGTAVFIFKRR